MSKQAGNIGSSDDSDIPRLFVCYSHRDDAIDRADVVLFFISPSSIASEHCRREIHYALDRDRKILPIYLEDVDLPGDHLGLSYLQALFVSANDYRDKLIGALSGDVASSIVARSSGRPGIRPLLMALVAVVVVAAGWWGYREYSAPTNGFDSMQDLELNVLPTVHIGITLPQNLSGSDFGPLGSRVIADDLTESLFEGTSFNGWFGR